MASLPTKDQLTGELVTKGAFKAALNQLIDFLNGAGLARLGFFAVTAQTAPDLTVEVSAGVIMVNSNLISLSPQLISGFTTPASNPRIDRVVFDPYTGVATRVEGVEAALPVAPTLPGGLLPLAQVRLTPANLAISDDQITDERQAVVPLRTAPEVDRSVRRSRLYAAQFLV